MFGVQVDEKKMHKGDKVSQVEQFEEKKEEEEEEEGARVQRKSNRFEPPTFALVPLLSKAPHKVPAVRAERKLPEEPGDKLVPIHLVYFLALHCTPALRCNLGCHKLPIS